MELGDREGGRGAVKVVLLGYAGVGKTTLVTRLTSPTPNPLIPLPRPTTGLDFVKWNLWLDDQGWVRVNMWDTGGQERYHSLLPLFCRGARGVLLLFDLSDLHSFQALHTCLRWAENVLPENACKLLVGNKLDLAERGHRAVTSHAARQWAGVEGADYLELSVMDSSGHALTAALTPFLRRTLLHTHPPKSPSSLPPDLPRDTEPEPKATCACRRL